jgi:iron complex transport system substrate-binding protein
MSEAQHNSRPMRICSLLPSATEILFALDCGDRVVGVTHECDYPEAAKAKPRLIRPRVDAQAAPGEIDRQVRALVDAGQSLYGVDAELLERLEPDLIVTQDLCHVCAASPEDLGAALARMARRPEVLTLTPHSLNDVWRDVERVGEAVGEAERGHELAAKLRGRVAAVAWRNEANGRVPVRVLCLEWLEPFYVAGHWVPEMVAKAGGVDMFGRAGEASFRVTFEQIARCGAEVILVMPCGYDTERAAKEFREMRLAERWTELPAVRDARVFAIDANSYTSRPGPRLADGVELLERILHGSAVDDMSGLPSDAVRRLATIAVNHNLSLGETMITDLLDASRTRSSS